MEIETIERIILVRTPKEAQIAYYRNIFEIKKCSNYIDFLIKNKKPSDFHDFISSVLFSQKVEKAKLDYEKSLNAFKDTVGLIKKWIEENGLLPEQETITPEKNTSQLKFFE